jgi:hypothetical protein
LFGHWIDRSQQTTELATAFGPYRLSIPLGPMIRDWFGWAATGGLIIFQRETYSDSV